MYHRSCGQSQVADIGLMGAPAKKDGKAVEGVDVFLGGAVGEGAWTACTCTHVRVCGGWRWQSSVRIPPQSIPTHPRTHGAEAALGEKFLKNVAMGDNDDDVFAVLGDLLVERFGAVKK